MTLRPRSWLDPAIRIAAAGLGVAVSSGLCWDHSSDASAESACESAKRAFLVAYDPSLKQEIQALLDQLCSGTKS